MTRMPGTATIYVGVRQGGRVRLTLDEARQFAAELVDLADVVDD